MPYPLPYNSLAFGEVLEMADRRDLGSRAERHEGSIPSFPTAMFLIQKRELN